MRVSAERHARREILSAVREYYHDFHERADDSCEQKIPYGGRVYDDEDMANLVDSALDFWLTSGRYTEEFEHRLADYIDVKYCSLVNSGSSANLCAFMALTSPLLGNRRIQRGDEVITVAAAFPTTVAPIVQYGAIPVFVDVTIPEYNIDVKAMESALSSKTKAVMLAHTLGNPFDIATVKKFCDANNLWLIADNCDSLGATYELEGVVKRTGSYGHIGTSSFYPPHHMTMGEGGAVYTDSPVLHKIIRSMRDWGRDCTCGAGQDDACGHRFERQFGDLPLGYDHKYVYSHFGYNLKATDLQAAIGCAQLDKLEHFVECRRSNFDYLSKQLQETRHTLVLPVATAKANPSWFGYLLTCIQPGMRDSVVRHLEAKGIQTRMLFAGNLIKHPCFDEMRESGTGFRVVGDLKNTDRIMNDSFWVGVYPGMTQAALDKIATSIKEAICANE